MADKKDKDKKEEGGEEEKDKKTEGEGEEGKEGQGAAADPAAKRKKLIKLAVLAVAGLLVLGGVGAGVYYSGILGTSKTEAKTKKGKKKKSEDSDHGTTGSSVHAVKQNLNDWVPGLVPGHEGDEVQYYNLPEFLVNLNTSGRQTSFIKMKVTLELSGDTDPDAVDGRMPRIIDSFNTYLRELRAGDVAGSAGLYRLREELLLRVNKTIYPNKVNDILFREIIIQ